MRNNSVVLEKIKKPYFVIVPSTSDITIRVFHFHKYILASTCKECNVLLGEHQKNNQKTEEFGC